jgi:hypothetical protein
MLFSWRTHTLIHSLEETMMFIDRFIQYDGIGDGLLVATAYKEK